MLVSSSVYVDRTHKNLSKLFAAIAGYLLFNDVDDDEDRKYLFFSLSALVIATMWLPSQTFYIKWLIEVLERKISILRTIIFNICYKDFRYFCHLP